MGACATKPKADETDAPALLPENEVVEKKEVTVAGTIIETKEVVDVGVDADKSRSLSNLFKESEQVKGSTENDKTRPEAVKEEACVADENTDISETKRTEVVKSEILVETTSTPTVNAAVVEAEKSIEVEAATEKIEISVEITAIPIVDAPATMEAEESIEVKSATEETETLQEKTSPIICAPDEVEADKEIEVASATEIQKTVEVEDTKIEEHDKAIEIPISESIEVESASGKTEIVEEKTSTPIVYAHVEVEADKEIAVAAANEIQKSEAAEEREVEEPDKVEETQKTESPEKIAEESKQSTELEKPAILPDEKSTEVKEFVEIHESKIEEEKEVMENQQAHEEKTAETEVCAANVKP